MFLFGLNSQLPTLNVQLVGQGASLRARRFQICFFNSTMRVNGVFELPPLSVSSAQSAVEFLVRIGVPLHLRSPGVFALNAPFRRLWGRGARGGTRAF
jgi:hypothetical protein